MAASSYACSKRQGFNFEKDKQDLVGYVNALTIGTVTLTPDMTLTDPVALTPTIAAVGVIESLSWNGGFADPVQLTFFCSTENQKQIATMLDTNLSSTKVSITWTTWAYDLDALAYYPCFHTNNAPVTGLVYKQNGELYLYADSIADPDIPSPPNFQITLAVMPDSNQQSIYKAVSQADKYLKQWGQSVTGS